MKWVILALILSGCAGSPAWNSLKISSTTHEADRNNEAIMDLKLGQQKEDVIALMGIPKKREVYRINEDKEVEFLFYRTTGWGGEIAQDMDSQFTPFAFEKEKLVGWGRNYYDRVVRVSLETKKAE